MLEEKIGGRFIREWKQDNNRANLVIVHGVSEHCGRYIHVAEYFHRRGFNVYTGDLLGHGLSDGARVYIKSADDYIDDVDLFISRIQDNKPIFILGHSMGGFVTLYYGVKRGNSQVKGLVVTSPYLKERLPIPKAKLVFGRVAAALYPKLRIKSGIKSQMVCRDEEVCSKYEKDLLNTDFVTAGWFTAMESARKYTLENISRLTCPCLMLQAGEDVIVDPEANSRFFEGIPAEDKEFELYKDFYHEILNDPEKERALSRIYEWLNRRI